MNLSVTTEHKSLQYSENQHYACENCPAKCCRFPWHIHVTPDEYDRYMNTPWVTERLTEKNTAFVAQNNGYTMPKVTRMDGSTACVFLDADQACAMQVEFGHDFIPQTCQQYPLTFIESDKQIHTVSSYFCPSILKNEGQPLASMIQGRFESFKQGMPVSLVPQSITVQGVAISQAALLQTASEIKNWFEQSEETVAQTFLRVRHLFQQMAAQGEAALATETALQTIVNQETENRLVLNKKSQTIQADTPARAMAAQVLVGLGAMTYFNRSLHADAVASVDQNTDTGKVGLADCLHMIQRILNLSLLKNKPEYLWEYGKPVDFQQADRIPLDVGQPEIQQHLKRYFAHLFAELNLFKEGQDLMRMLFNLAVGYAQILTLSQSVAYLKKHDRVLPEDVLEAIGYVDLSISSKGRMPAGFLNNLIETIISLLSDRPETFEKLLFII